MSGISTGGTPLILASPAPSTGGGGGGVTSLNGLIGAVTFTPGANITFTPSGNGFIISATGGGGTPGGVPTNIQFNNSGVFGGVPGSSADGINGTISIAPTGTGPGLTLTGDANGSPIFVFNTNDGNYGGIINGSGGIEVQAATGDVATFDGVGDGFVYVDTDGNLGITSAGLFDSTGSLGTAGEVLSSTGTEILWIPASGGTIGGTTTSPFVPYTVSADTLADSLFSYGVSSGVPSLNATFTDTDPYIVSLGADAAISSAPGFSIQDLTTLYALYGNVIPGGSAFVGLEDLGTDAGINFNLVSDVPSLNLTDGTSPYSISIVGGVLQIGGPSNNILVDENGNTTINDNLNLANATITDSAASVGTSGQFLSSTGTGVEWVAGGGGGTPGGVPTNIQFNDSGMFGGISGSTADGTNGLMALAPTGTGVALTVHSDTFGSDAIDIIAMSTPTGNGLVYLISNFGGTLVTHHVDDTDGASAPTALVFFAQETDSTGSGVAAYGVIGQTNLAGTNNTGTSVGGFFRSNDSSTGGTVREVSGLIAAATGTARTTLATGLHVQSIQSVTTPNSFGILIDSQSGFPAISTAPADPSYFGSLAVGGTGGSQASTAPSWSSGSGVPTSTPVKGSLYSRTGGSGLGTSLYVYDGALWTPVAGV